MIPMSARNADGERGKMRVLLVLSVFLAACGGPFMMIPGNSDLKEGYDRQIAMNPELVCTPHMAQEVWTSIRDEYYKPVSDKEIFAGAIVGLSKGLGRTVAMPKWASDDDYGLYQFWLQIGRAHV